MKRYSIGILILCVVGGMLIGCNSIFSGGKSWVAKIDNKKITITEFDAVFREISSGMTQTDFPQRYSKGELRNYVVNELIRLKLVFEDAKKSGFLADTEWKYLIEQTTIDAIAQYYIVNTYMDDIIITETDINDWYARNQALLAGYAVAEAMTLASNYVRMEKVQEKIEALVNDLKNEMKVERNQKALQPLKDGEKVSAGEWIAKIDGRPMSRQAFITIINKYVEEGSIEQLGKNDPDLADFDPTNPDDRLVFLDKMIETRLAYLKAQKDGFFNDPAHKAMIRFTRENTISQLYLAHKFGDIVLTDEDVIAFAERYRKLEPAINTMMKDGLSADEIQRLRPYAEQFELNEKMENYIDDLRLAHRIERNPDAYRSQNTAGKTPMTSANE